MKTMKKILALALAAMLVMSLATTAFAAEGDIYEIYQIFTADITEKDGATVLSNVKWGKNGTGTEGTAVEQTVLDALTAVNNGTDAEQLAVIEQYATLSNPYETGAANTYNLPNGYYLVRNVPKSQEGEGAFYTLHVVKVVNGTLTFTRKGDVPKVEKTVNDTDLNIGDTVTFTLTATMPSTFEGYESYKVIFHDTLSAGLDFTEDSVTVKIGENDVTSYFTTTENNGELIISCNNVLADTVGATVSSKIVVTYTAVLDSDAIIGTEGNLNEVYLEYSNDPNWDGTPGSDDEPTGDTPKDDVKVYTWDMEVLKYADGDETKVLEGVKFILLNQAKTKIAKVKDGKLVSWDDFTENMDVTAYKLTTDASGKISIDGLKSGTYYLRETDTLPGYNKLTKDEEAIVDNNTDGNYATYVAKVNNQSGSTLPETGGMGTTMFYVFGSIMVLAAVILLVTKKRMNIA